VLRGQLQQQRHLESEPPSEECFVCHIVQIHVLFEYEEHWNDTTTSVPPPSSSDNTPSDFSCISDTRNRGYREVFSIALPDDFIQAYSTILHAGLAYACLQGAVIDVEEKSVHIPSHATVSLLDDDTHHNRRLAVARQGKKRLLAIRVTTTYGEEPEESLDLMEGTLFGTGSLAEPHNAVTQYDALSHGKFGYIPAQGATITNGVTEIVVDMKIEGTIMSPSFQDTIKEAAVKQLGNLDEIADQIAYCIPNGSLLFDSSKWTGFTFLYETVRSTLAIMSLLSYR
jgi:hypothetical protein